MLLNTHTTTTTTTHACTLTRHTLTSLIFFTPSVFGFNLSCLSFKDIERNYLINRSICTTASFKTKALIIATLKRVHHSGYVSVNISCYHGKRGISLWVICYIPQFELAVRRFGINHYCSLSHLTQDKLGLV